MMTPKYRVQAISRDNLVIISYIGGRLKTTQYQPFMQRIAHRREAANICVEETGYLTMLLTARNEEAFIA